MRVLAIVPPASVDGVWHLNALASAGWDVHAVPTEAAPFHTDLDGRICTHYQVRPGADGPLAMVERHGDVMRQRVRAVAVRLKARSGRTPRYAWSAHTGQAASGGVAATDVVAWTGPWAWQATGAWLPWLARLIDRLRPDVVYSGPLKQAATYTYAARVLARRPFPIWLVSSFGMDLGFWTYDATGRTAARAILSSADGYLAESDADLVSARQLGLAAPTAGVMPGCAGVSVEPDDAAAAKRPPSARRAITINGQQDATGRALVALDGVRRCAQLLNGWQVIVHAAGEDVRMAAELLSVQTGLRLTVRPMGTPLAAVAADQADARASIGLSIAGSPEAWHLQGLSAGAFPIQSQAPWSDDWGKDGQTALLVHPEEPEQVAIALRRVLADDALVDGAHRNRATVRACFDRAALVPQLLATYERALVAR